MQQVRMLCLLLPTLGILSLPAAAQTVSLKQVVPGGGGGSSTTGYRLISTVGQPCVGRTASGLTTHFVGFLTPAAGIAALVEELFEVPEQVSLAQNHPNPFNPITTIRFDLPDSRHVCLEVFSMDGRRVATLIDEELAPGRLSVTWDGTDASGHAVASGIYTYRLSAGSFRASNRMVLSK